MALKTNRKSSHHTWSDVKAALADIDERGLVGLISDLYRLSKENQAFLHARFGVGDAALRPYKKTINACMYPNIYTNKPVQIAKAKKAISAYSKAIGDPHGEAELMIFFVECGNNYTLDLGDIDAAFYNALNRMYLRAIDKVLTLPEEERGEFRDRLKAVMDSSSGIGWGYHDTLCSDYYEAFFEDELNTEPPDAANSAKRRPRS